MAKQMSIEDVVRFVTTTNGCGVDAIVQHPTDTSRVATQNICTVWSGMEMAEFIVTALEFYRTHMVRKAVMDQNALTVVKQ